MPVIETEWSTALVDDKHTESSISSLSGKPQETRESAQNPESFAWSQTIQLSMCD